MNDTINVKDISRGSMPMVRALPKALRVCLVSADTISFEARRNIRRTVDMAPNVAPTANVAIVIVVVTVEIIESPFSAFLYHSIHYKSIL